MGIVKEEMRYNKRGEREWYRTSDSVRSPRLDGKIQLRQNPYYYIEGVTLQYDNTGGGDIPNFGAFPILQNRRATSLDCYKRVYENLAAEARGRAQAAVAVDAAEGRQTFRMIESSVSTLYRGARYIRRGNFLEAARVFRISKPRGLSNRTQDFLDNWMAYRYGWAPLLSSVHDTWDALAIKSGPKDHLFRFTASGRHSEKGLLINDRVTARGVMRVTNVNLARMSSLGLTNPALVAWELVPASFVLDWFLPIGDYLQTLDNFVGVEFSDFSLTYTGVCESEQFYCQSMDPHGLREGWHMGPPPYPGYINPYKGPNGALQYTSHLRSRAKVKRRTLLASPPKPIFGIENGLNPQRLLDSIALLCGVLKPLKKTSL